MAEPPRPFDVSDLLATVPVVNEAVRERKNGRTLVLYVPIRKRWWMRPPLSWMPGVQFRDERGVALDELGQEVWRQIDGRRSTEQIVETFADRHRLRFHEARLTVMEFLRMLMARQLIAAVAPGSEEVGTAHLRGGAERGMH